MTWAIERPQASSIYRIACLRSVNSHLLDLTIAQDLVEVFVGKEQCSFDKEGQAVAFAHAADVRAILSSIAGDGGGEPTAGPDGATAFPRQAQRK